EGAHFYTLMRADDIKPSIPRVGTDPPRTSQKRNKTMTKTTPKANLLEETINQGSQDVTARRVLSLGDFKVRLTIKSDSYKFQSFARAEVWNPATLSWNHVHSIH